MNMSNKFVARFYTQSAIHPSVQWIALAAAVAAGWLNEQGRSRQALVVGRTAMSVISQSEAHEKQRGVAVEVVNKIWRCTC